MNPVATVRTISLEELRRNLGEIKKELQASPYLTFILTDRGGQVGVLTATREMKRNLMKSTAGSFKGTALEDDSLWKAALKKHSRKEKITL